MTSSLRPFVGYVLIGFLAGLILIFAVHHTTKLGPADAAVVGPPADVRFFDFGRSYLPQLGRAYAAAWISGAEALEKGESLSAAVGTVGQEFTANRTKLFDAVVTPELSKIVSESTSDADVTSAQRATMAAAFRGMAMGLNP